MANFQAAEPVTSIATTPASAARLVGSLLSASQFSVGNMTGGGPVVTYVMRARIVTTTTYVYWAVQLTPDLTGQFSGYSPIANLTDFAVHAKIVR